MTASGVGVLNRRTRNCCGRLMSAKSIISAARAFVINFMRPFAALRAVTDDLNLPINKIRNSPSSLVILDDCS